MSLVKLNVPPGFVKKGTAYGAQGRWREGNMVRFQGADLRPVGGWQLSTLLSSTVLQEILGTVRSVHTWKDNLDRTWTAIGTTQKLYALRGTELYDITPAGVTLPGEFVGAALGYGTGDYNTGDYNTAIGTPGTSSSGSAIVYGYWTLDNWGENLNASIDSDGRIFEWDPNTPATDAVPLSGDRAATMTLQAGGAGYAINDTITLTGGTFSQAIILTVTGVAAGAVTTFTITNAGKYTTRPTNPVAQGSTSGAGAGATFNVTAWAMDAPQFVRSFIVTNERHLLTVGVKDGTAPKPRRVAWSDFENNEDFQPGITSLAGDVDLQTEGVGIRCYLFKRQALVFTDADLHRMNYEGYPFGYTQEKVGDGCGLVCPGAVAKSADILFWVSARGFFIYDGRSVTPLACELFDNPEDAIALIATNKKLTVGHNELHNEFWIFYSTTPGGNPDRYIAWNYQQNHWFDGELDRSCWYGSDVGKYVLAAQPYESSGFKSRLYIHEVGTARPNYDGEEYAELAPLELGSGDKFLHIDRILQDSDLNEGSRLQVTLTFYKALDTAPLKTFGPVPLDTVRGYTDVRGCGRFVVIRISAAAGQGDWRVGKWRIEVREDMGR